MERRRPRKAQISVDHPDSFTPGLITNIQSRLQIANCKSRSLVTITVWLPIDLHHFDEVQLLSQSHYADRGEAYEKPASKSEEKGRKTE